MIQQMKKLTFLVYHKEYEHFLIELQKLGVLHIQPSEDQSKAEPEQLRQLKAQLQEVQQVKSDLMKLTGIFDEDIPQAEADNQTHKRVLAIQERLRILAATLDKAQRDEKLLRPWGNIDKAQMQRMHEAGLQEYYYQVSLAHFDKELSEYRGLEVSRDNKFVYFMTFSLDGNEPEGIPAIPLNLPETAYSEVQAQVAALRKEQSDLTAERMDIATNHIGAVKAYETQLTDAIAREEANQDTLRAAGETVMVLEGWFPVSQMSGVEHFLQKAHAYYEMRDPVSSDTVPTQFRNNRYNRMFERLTKMYGYPCYNEWDPTPVVAPFFTLFFAICMGDAGYGIIIMLYGLFEIAGKAKKTPIVGEMVHGAGDMVFALGVATTIVGLILGSFFGLNPADIPGIPETVKNYYTIVQGNFPGTHYSFQMVGAIIIGVVHLLIAMAVKAVLYSRKEGIQSQISQWGWVILFYGLIITGAVSMVCSLPEQTTLYIIIGIGAVSALCIYLLNNVASLKSNFIKGIIINPLAGLYDTYNMASGLMGDVLSYIRLYALCLAGGMLGQAFNTIGNMIWDAGAGKNIVAAGLCIAFALLIYGFGHLLNLLLSCISAFVHPLRLNFVEYFKNSGYEGKGIGYKPLANK